MSTAYLEGFVDLFRSSLEVLAATPTEQITYLADLGVPGGIDELALQFDDAMPMLPQLLTEGLVPEEAGAALTAVDAALTALNDGPDELWSEEGLAAPAWQTVRTLAADALRCLPVPGSGSTTPGRATRSAPITAT